MTARSPRNVATSPVPSAATLLLLLCLTVIVSRAAAASLTTTHGRTANELSTSCVYSKKDWVRIASLGQDDDEALDDELHKKPDPEWEKTGRQTCSKNHGLCYTLWQEVPTVNVTSSKNATTPTVVILAQGCWEASSDDECLADDCVSKKRPAKGQQNSTKFCCCQGSLCNVDFRDGYDPANDTDLMDTRSLLQSADLDANTPLLTATLLTVIGAALFLAFLLASFTFAGYRLCGGSEGAMRKDLDSLHLTESQSSHLSLSSPSFDLETLKLEQLIGHGRYGSVYNGTLLGETVAIKVFAAQHRQYYVNERAIYMEPFMEHPSLPRFFGAEEKLVGDGLSRVEYHLVLSCASRGCLQDFLRGNTVDWPTLCRMIQSLAAGVAYLHSEITKGDKTKSCIAHRDLSSRNILVNEDRSCVICDFGFALKIRGSKCVVNGVEQSAESTPLTDVGTMRYMAPELLEGAVNLRDCETSLKQIDVYAMSLIMWEIASRCSDLYQGMVVPDYRQPFEADLLGNEPSYEQMQVTVTRQKSRPLFPDIFKDTNPAIRTLKETISECWDHDGEARLTALCVEERVAEWPVLWDRHRAALVSGHGNLPLPRLLAANGITLTTSNASADGILPFNNQRNVLSLRNNHLPGDSHALPVHNHNKVTNQLNTVRDTSANAFNAQQQQQTRDLVYPLQPYQGRNPCSERNTLNSRDLSDDGSRRQYLEHGFKFSSRAGRSPDGSSSWSDPNSADTRCLVPNNTSSSSASSSTHVREMIQNRPGPVPNTIQNVISSGFTPKQPNLPGNGHRQNFPAIHAPSQMAAAPNASPPPSDSLASKLIKWTKHNGKSIFNRRRSGDGLVEETEPLSASTSYALASPALLGQTGNPYSMIGSGGNTNSSSAGESVRETRVSVESDGSLQTRLLSEASNSHLDVSMAAATQPKSEMD